MSCDCRCHELAGLIASGHCFTPKCCADADQTLEKDAGGDILGRLAGIVSRPFVGAQRAQGIQNSIVSGITRRVNQPIENAMRRTGIHGAISKVYEHGTRPVPGPLGKMRIPGIGQPYLPEPAQRRAYGQWRADDLVHTFANNPEMVGAIAVPIPGAAEGYLAGKHFLGKALGGRVKKLAAYTPAFADELEKLANGDMLQYFMDHPEKLEEKQERDRRKKELEKRADELEEAYWEFDARRAGRYPRDPAGALGPQAERDAFKAAIENMAKEAEVYPYQQKTQWTCSAACLKAVLAHHGMRVPELVAIQAVGAQPGRGAECDQIAAAARQFGFHAFEYSFESVEQAKTLLDQGLPIICDVQSFNNPGKGHYVVMTNTDGARVQLMDPNTPGNWRVLSRADMEAR